MTWTTENPHRYIDGSLGGSLSFNNCLLNPFKAPNLAFLCNFKEKLEKFSGNYYSLLCYELDSEIKATFLYNFETTSLFNLALHQDWRLVTKSAHLPKNSPTNTLYRTQTQNLKMSCRSLMGGCVPYSFNKQQASVWPCCNIISVTRSGYCSAKFRVWL